MLTEIILWLVFKPTYKIRLQSSFNLNFIAEVILLNFRFLKSLSEVEKLKDQRYYKVEAVRSLERYTGKERILFRI